MLLLIFYWRHNYNGKQNGKTKGGAEEPLDQGKLLVTLLYLIHNKMKRKRDPWVAYSVGKWNSLKDRLVSMRRGRKIQFRTSNTF